MGYDNNGYNQNGYNQNNQYQGGNNPYGQNPYGQNAYDQYQQAQQTNQYMFNQGNQFNMNGQNNQGYNLNGQYTNNRNDSAPVSISMDSVLVRAFGFMFIALLLSAITAFAVASDINLCISLVTGGTFWILVIAEFALVFGTQFAIRKNNVVLSAILFTGYSIINGATLSVILLVYTISSIVSVFFVCCAMFGAMAIFGAVTKKDLSKMGSVLIMGLFGIILMTLVNIFLNSSGLDMAISYIGVLIFVGLTAYDTQKIKKLAASHSGYSDNTIALWGAMELYLDFINLFLKLLRILGKARN